jgi:hypothetical protein
MFARTHTYPSPHRSPDFDFDPGSARPRARSFALLRIVQRCASNSQCVIWPDFVNLLYVVLVIPFVKAGLPLYQQTTSPDHHRRSAPNGS